MSESEFWNRLLSLERKVEQLVRDKEDLRQALVAAQQALRKVAQNS